MCTLVSVNIDLSDFLGPKRTQLLGCKNQNFQERWRQRYSTGTKIYNVRGRLWDYRIGYVLQQIGKFVSTTDSYNVQGYGRTTQAGSQNSSLCGPSKQRDLYDTAAVQSRHVREVKCSSPVIWKEEGRWKVSTNCKLCE